MKVIGIIPARYASTRFPGKPLAMIGGQSMLERVWRQAKKARQLSRVLVATDDARIFDAVLRFGGEVVMTPPTCASGTDRLAKACQRLSGDVIVNIQGDEPFISPAYLDRLVAPFLTESKLQMATLAAPLPQAEMADPHAVKVVCDRQGNALYFSRAPIPYFRQAAGYQPLLHLGIYAYRRKFLLSYAQWPQTPLEKTEQLEQLRALENGIKLRVIRVKNPSLSVDTPEDLMRAQALAAKQRR